MIASGAERPAPLAASSFRILHRSSSHPKFSERRQHRWSSVAGPLDGAGTGGFDTDHAGAIITPAFKEHSGSGTVEVWHYEPSCQEVRACCC